MTADSIYKSNIHERRLVATFCRAVPMLSVLITTSLCLYGAFRETLVLLWVSAFFNVVFWIYIVTTGLQCMYALLVKLHRLDVTPASSAPLPCSGTHADSGAVESADDTSKSTNSDSMVHLIVLPNYKEDEAMLADTLRSLAESETSKSFWIVLAMEEREGDEGKQKAIRLQSRFASDFARVIYCNHPMGVVERHEDGSEHLEVPGKASNLKFAVDRGYQECSVFGIQSDCVLLTVADADCIFHPLYFSQVGREFDELRKVNQHQWTMWQAPQFPWRNFYTSPIVSRVWGYLASAYELGGLTGTSWGGHHMVFSCYSVPLALAHNAQAWDGDVIAEDHHAWLKCFYHWVHHAANKNPALLHDQSAIRVRPIFLPVKSTSVANEVYWKSWTDRWQQAKRHAQGVAELPYALLATYDICRTCLWPKRIFSWSLLYRMVQVILRLWCMHILPICQGIALGALTVKWILYNRHLPLCPDRLYFVGNPDEYFQAEKYLCGFAGAWALTWPVLIPWFLIVVSNVLVMHQCFLRPAAVNGHLSLWHSEDGKVPAKHGLLTALSVILFDCIFGMCWILVPYGLLVQLIAYCNVLLYGNSQFSYVCASKGTTSKLSEKAKYGALETATYRVI